MRRVRKRPSERAPMNEQITTAGAAPATPRCRLVRAASTNPSIRWRCVEPFTAPGSGAAGCVPNHMVREPSQVFFYPGEHFIPGSHFPPRCWHSRVTSRIARARGAHCRAVCDVARMYRNPGRMAHFKWLVFGTLCRVNIFSDFYGRQSRQRPLCRAI